MPAGDSTIESAARRVVAQGPVVGIGPVDGVGEAGERHPVAAAAEDDDAHSAAAFVRRTRRISTGAPRNDATIIVGIALAAMLGALNTWLTVKGDIEFAMAAALWGAGSLSGVSWLEATPALIVLAALRGTAVERVKIGVIAVGVALTAVVTAVAGPVSFVALAAPQVAQRMTRRGASVDLAGSAAVGAALLSTADLFAQHGIPGIPLPVGAVTVCVGGLYLIWLLTRGTARR